MVSAVRADLQRTDSDETAGLARRVTDGAAETPALSDFQHSRKTDSSRAPDDSAFGANRQPVQQLGRSDEQTAPAPSHLNRPGVLQSTLTYGLSRHLFSGATSHALHAT